MFLSIWNYLRGYVTIQVSGFSAERFMNLASHRGIYLWDIHRNKGKMQMKVSITGFKLLKDCAKKTKCKVKIVEKKGWPFVAHRYRKRKMMALGIFVFLGILYLMSSFIWVIEISGNERIALEELIEALNSHGVKLGVLKNKIDNTEIEGFLRENFDDISWTAVNIKGTKITIELNETVIKPEIVDQTTPCDLVAEKTGLIVSITTRAGTPKVKPKDIVKKGEVLVSGQLIVKEDEEGVITKYVHADADVIAKTRYEIKHKQPLYYIEKQYTDNIKKQYAISLLDKELNLLKPRISFQHYDKIISNKQLAITKNFVLPVQGITYEYKEYIPVKHKWTIEEAKNLVQEEIQKKLLEQIEKDSEILNQEIQYHPKEDSLGVEAVFTIKEHIDKVQAIDRRKLIDGTKGKDTTDTD
ncbi:MAG: sporulation protein YqfD [Epulopiscium sp.]|nr:sporulation protein YqfD [Candidatus Epulonipiscium sp.]